MKYTIVESIGTKTINRFTVETTKEQLLQMLKNKREANKNTKYYKVYSYIN
jgi:hypothetical protein